MAKKKTKRTTKVTSTPEYFFSAIRLDSWDLVRNCARKLSKLRWVFRGHANADWGLSTTFERSAERQNYNMAKIKRTTELAVIRTFRTCAHHYISDPPDEDDRLKWLALIQHHGGPTRLLDFTSSFYVAAFFAVDEASTDSAIWAVNASGLEKLYQDANNISRNVNYWKFQDAVRQGVNAQIGRSAKHRFVLPVELDVHNIRLASQQGLFLFPSDISASFTDNLCTMAKQPNDIFKTTQPIVVKTPRDIQMQSLLGYVLKIIIPHDIRKKVLSDLRDMNITATSLFPGLDGFARSLHYHLSLFQN